MSIILSLILIVIVHVCFLFFLDIDECLQQPCHQNATCEDTVGNFNCSCSNGFDGDGFNCTSN